jgi:hypothetical protein
LFWLFHRFVCWLTAARGNTAWRWAHSAAVVALLLSGSAAAIAMSGITHQLAWLAKEPWLMDRNRVTERTEALVRVRELLMATLEFRTEEDRYPDSLDELERFKPGIRPLLWIKVGGGAVPEKVIYLKPSPEDGEAGSAEVTLFISPALRPDGSVVIGRGDLSTAVIAGTKVEDILRSATSHGN